MAPPCPTCSHMLPSHIPSPARTLTLSADAVLTPPPGPRVPQDPAGAGGQWAAGEGFGCLS